MIPTLPGLPENEEERLITLYNFKILDTPCEMVFDTITELASSICNTPIAAISLIDKDRQWFKSIKGLDVKETDRNVAFCAYTILTDGIMEIKDAMTDPVFKNNPLVTNDPKILFYAGVPLKTSTGVNIGSLCVIDQKINSLTDKQQTDLKALAHIVMTLIESRKKMIEDNLQIQAYLSELKGKNRTLRTRVREEKELENLCKIFNQVYNIILSSKTIEEALIFIKKYCEQMFPTLCDSLCTDNQKKPASEIFQHITPREKQVLRLLALGYSIKKIAQDLVISEKTAARHVENLCKKNHCFNKSDLIIKVFKNGYFIELITSNDTQTISDHEDL
jgi:DNA-binding CsgD family transcriptional regulator